MKKHLFTLCLAVLLLAAWVLPVCASSYYDDLWAKFDRQMESGSGYIATLTGKTEGSSILAGMGLSLNDLTGDVTLIRDQRQPEIYQGTLKLKRGETDLSEIMLYGDKDQAALRADFLTEDIRFPLTAAADLLMDKETDYGWIQMLMALSACEDEIWLAQMEKAGEAYQLDFEMWLAKYAKVSADTVEGAMTIDYVIPAEDLKAQMQSMLVQLMGDKDMLAVLKQLVTAEQANRYLEPNWAPQYLNILSGIELDGQVEVTHKQSMKGELLSTRVVLPLPAHLTEAYDTLVVEADDDHWYFSLSGESTVALRWDKQQEGNESKASGSLTVDTEMFKAAVEFAFESEKKEFKDADNREYLATSWKLAMSNGKPGEEGYLAFEPMTLVYQDNLNSGPDRRNATYTDISLALQGPEGTDTLTLSGKTAVNWKLADTEILSVKSFAEMESEAANDFMLKIADEVISWVKP